MRFSRYKVPFIVSIVLLGLLLAGGIVALVDISVQRAVQVHAEDRARRWSQFIANLEGIDELLATRKPTPAQLEQIHVARDSGTVFGVSLYDKSGNLLIGDTDQLRSEGLSADPMIDPNALRATISGTTVIVSYRAEADQVAFPRLYTKAYVPLLDEKGNVRGLAKFYIDQTVLFDIISGTFRNLVLFLVAIFVAAFTIPAVAFVLRARVAEDATRAAHFLTRHDRLTRTLNRTVFTELFAEQLREAAQTKMLVAVVHLDIRQFKVLNDMHGYALCDTLLIQVADQIRAGLRADDLIARFGADSFVFSFCGQARDALEARIDAILDAITEPKMIDGKLVTIAVSAGGDIFQPNRVTNVNATLNRSEIALLQAQVSGDTRFLAYDPGFESSLRLRRDHEKRVLRATEDEQFEVFYQPLLDQETRRINGFEALLRLPDGIGGYISPAEFIPVAEEMGLINRVGAWVLNDAMRTARNWPRDITVSVNLSARQFEDGQIVDTVKRALEAQNFPASRLTLEVTETVLMKDGADVAEQLMDLRMLGARIAMDDFGIGYSSLGYLWKFGFDKIKIDRSFISEMGSASGKADEVVATIIMLGHKLDMTVTAEGIETAAQVRMLAALGCDEFQGFYFGKPVPAETVREMLETTEIRQRA